MCTVVVLWRPDHAWPVVLAANRDELVDRAWDPPGAHWPGRPGVIGGRDRLGNGTWMAYRAGVFAAVLNRPGSLGPQPGKRSRGELPLLALEAEGAAGAVAALSALDARQYRTFNMVLADRQGAFFLRGTGAGRVSAEPLPPGISMVTAHDPNDPASLRVRTYLPRFQAATAPDPATGDWSEWTRLLGDRSGPRGGALTVPVEGGFGTVCASLAALGADGAAVWRFAPGPSDQVAFGPVTLP